VNHHHDPDDPLKHNDGHSIFDHLLPKHIAISNADSDIELGFWPGFINSYAMIIATEIGDKTFFIAAVLSMSNSRSSVFAGSYSALIIMTILSAVIGLALPALLPRYVGERASRQNENEDEERSDVYCCIVASLLAGS